MRIGRRGLARLILGKRMDKRAGVRGGVSGNKNLR